MTTDSWTSSGSGLWSVAADWSLGEPNANETAAIVETSPLTVTFDLSKALIGALTLSDATLDLEGGPLTVKNGASLSSATIAGKQTLALYGASTATGLSLAGSAAILNGGTITQSGGTVAIGDTSGSKAKITNNSAATWIVSDASGMTSAETSGWAFVNKGVFQKTLGSGIALIQANFDSTGTIASAGGGDIEFDGKSTYLAGTYIGSGMVDYGPDGISMVGVVNVTSSCCQTNFGFVKLVGDMTMHDGSTIANGSGARWDFAGDTSIWLASGESAGPNINGAGLIEKTVGTGVSTIAIDAELSGLVSVATGTLAFEGASSTFSGPIEGAGTFEIAGGQAMFDPGASLSVADWTLSGGNTMFSENTTYKGVFTGDAGATITLQNYQFLTFSGPTTINHQVEISGLAITGAGYVQLDADTDISGATIGGTVQVDDMFVVSQTGNLTLGDSSASDATYINLVHGGDWLLLGSASISVGADVRSTINIGLSVGGDDAETLTKSGTGVSVVAPNVVNENSNIPSGTGFQPRGVVVTGGTLDFQGTVEGTGTDTLISSTNNLLTEPVLEFDAAVGSGQTVVFSGLDAELHLTDLPAFSGAIDGFGSGDSLLLGGGYYVLTGQTETATSATLSFVDSSRGNSPASLILTGDYIGHTFMGTRQTGGALLVN